MRKPLSNPQFGFTLVELFITLAVAAILLSIAAPSFKEATQNNRLTGQVNEFVRALSLARTEAIKRGVPVTVCKSNNGNDCGTSGVNWENGWIVFVESSRPPGGTDGTVDVLKGETVIQVFSAISGGNTMRGDTLFVNRISYMPSGTSNTNGSLTFCDDRGATKARAVIVSQTGRARTADASGASLSCP